MLSTLHFYNNYNSFILDKEKIRERKASPYLQYKKQSNQYKDTEFKYFLNKSLNDNIKAYMFELSANFNGLKNIVNNIYEKIYHNLPMETLDDKLESFTTMYNRFIGFLEENTENSGEFKDILDNTKNNTTELLQCKYFNRIEGKSLSSYKQSHYYVKMDGQELMEHLL